MATFTEEERAILKAGGKLTPAMMRKRRTGETQRMLGTGAFAPGFSPATPEAFRIAQAQGAPLSPETLALAGSNVPTNPALRPPKADTNLRPFGSLTGPTTAVAGPQVEAPPGITPEPPPNPLDFRLFDDAVPTIPEIFGGVGNILGNIFNPQNPLQTEARELESQPISSLTAPQGDPNRDFFVNLTTGTIAGVLNNPNIPAAQRLDYIEQLTLDPRLDPAGQSFLNQKAADIRENERLKSAIERFENVNIPGQDNIDAFLANVLPGMFAHQAQNFRGDPFNEEILGRISSILASPDAIDAGTEAQLRGRAADRIKGEAAGTKQRIQEDLLRRGILDSGLQAGIERQVSQQVARDIAAEEREIGIQRALARSQRELAAAQIGSALTGQIAQTGLQAGAQNLSALTAAGGLGLEGFRAGLQSATAELGREQAIAQIIQGQSDFVPDILGLAFGEQDRADMQALLSQVAETQGADAAFRLLETIFTVLMAFTPGFG